MSKDHQESPNGWRESKNLSQFQRGTHQGPDGWLLRRVLRVSGMQETELDRMRYKLVSISIQNAAPGHASQEEKAWASGELAASL